MDAPSSPATSLDATDPSQYALGRSTAEAERLALQHRLFGPSTEAFLRAGGIGPGMRVLDVGSGAGDVAMLLAGLVGPTGEVVGVEFAPESIAMASSRVEAAGVGAIVRFVQADLRDLDLDEGSFDGAVGRWVLMYQPDPADLLRRLAALVRPGGIVAFQESDLAEAPRPFPTGPLHERVRVWMTPPPGIGGPELRMGPRLNQAFLAAGLPAPDLRVDVPVGAGPDWPGYAYLAATLRSLLPMLTAMGVATLEEVDIDTLADRLRDEIVEQDGVHPLPPLYGASTTVS